MLIRIPTPENITKILPPNALHSEEGLTKETVSSNQGIIKTNRNRSKTK